MRKLKILICFLCAASTFAAGCGGGSGSIPNNQGFVAVRLVENQDFNPSGEHGRLENIKVTITGEGLSENIVRYYPAGTEGDEFEGFAAGTRLNIVLEALNENGLVVRRGRAEEVLIEGGKMVPVSIEINNVPIFANVHEGSVVNPNRFVPRIFAPNLTFEIEDIFGETTSFLTDAISGEASFSLSESVSDGIMTVFTEPLTPGEHILTVRDPNTLEESSIQIRVSESTRRPVLTTTAGSYFGVPMHVERGSKTNFILVNQHKTER